MKYIVDPNTSINETLKKIKDGDTLFLKQGIYNEKLDIYINNINIIGENKETTIITNNDYYHKIMKDNNECNTFRTYTMLIGGNNVNIENITIENSSTSSSKYGQAIALYVDGDNFKCNNSIIKSAQDTLFTGPLPKNLKERYKGFLNDHQINSPKSKQIYTNTKIIGDVDFIFGGAQVLFYNCEIMSIKRTTNPFENNGYIAAPSHDIDDKYGYLFYKCTLTSNDESTETYLARPWRDYGNSCFIDCEYKVKINPLGFNKWDGTERDKTCRFFEYNEKYDLTNRDSFVKILTDVEKNDYLNDFFKFMNLRRNDYE